MSFGLLSGILGGGKTSAANNIQQQTSAPAAPNATAVNQFNTALNNAYSAGLNQGLATAQTATATPVTIYNYAGGATAGVTGQGGQNFAGSAASLPAGYHSHDGANTFHTHGSNVSAVANTSLAGNLSANTGFASNSGTVSSTSIQPSASNTVSNTAGINTNGGLLGSGGLGGVLGAVDQVESNLLGGLLGGGANGGVGGIVNGLLGSITGGGKADLLGGLLGGGQTGAGNTNGGGLLGGLLGGGAGGVGNPIGGIVGGAASAVHGIAETVIDGTGLGGLFAPIDDAIIHPILWDPISQFTGMDVSAHPEGIANVSDPLGVRGGK